MESHVYSNILSQFISKFQLAPDLPERKSCLGWGLSVVSVLFSKYLSVQHNQVAVIISLKLTIRLKPAKRTPPKTSHIKAPTHNELRTRRPMW